MVAHQFVAAALAVMATVAALDQSIAKVSKPDSAGAKPHAVRVVSRPIVHFRKDGRAVAMVGKLKWRGGLVLTSSDAAFGGYSGLAISRDGRHLLAVSDAGTWLSASLGYRNGRPVSVEGARIGPLKALGNRDLRRRRDRDAEGVRLVRGSPLAGLAAISFEINQRIGFFPIRNGVIAGPSHYLRPGARLPSNKGLEAVALVGRARKAPDIIAFAERALDANRHHRGWIWARGKGRPRPVALTAPDGFDVTDAVGLSDGRLLVLERRFRWSEGVRMRIREIAAAKIRPGAVLSGRTLLRADMRYEIDNMEGLAVHTDKRGRTILTVISDNNFNSFLQRTVLLQFELPDNETKPAQRQATTR